MRVVLIQVTRTIWSNLKVIEGWSCCWVIVNPWLQWKFLLIKISTCLWLMMDTWLLMTGAKFQDEQCFMVLDIRATSHTSQELWSWNCESRKESVRIEGGPNTPPKLCSVVWSRTLKCSVSHMWWDPWPNANSMNFYSCGSSHVIMWNKSAAVSVWSAIMVSRFCVGPTSLRRSLKIVKGTLKHYPFNAMWESM